MAVYDLEEQEQLDELKTWWKQYGNLVTGLLLALAVGVAGWQGWTWYQRNQSAQASSVYMALQQAVAQGEANRVKSLAGDLIGKYSGSPYATMGALVSARVQVQAGDVKTAQAQLTWAAENAADEGLRDLARLRLATILLDEKSYDEATKHLTKEPTAAFAARFGELRGDVLAAQGKFGEARAAYEAAIKHSESSQKGKENAGDAAPGGNSYREMLRAKLESLGGAK